MTQLERVINYMKRHGSITSLEAFNFGCTRLAAVVAYLEEKKGIKIKHTRESSKNRDGITVSYSRYYLEDENGI